MVAAGEEVAEFVGEKNSEESGGERHASEKAGGIFVEESEGAEKIVERDGFVVSVSDGELSAGGEAGAERGEKKGAGEEERFERRAGKNGAVGIGDGRESAPINGGWERVERGVGGRRGHKEFRV